MKWVQTQREAREKSLARLELEANCWIALEELGKISQGDIHSDDEILYELYRDKKNNETYHIEAGVSAIFLRCGDSRPAKHVELRYVPTRALVKLLEIAGKT